ncbi:MAG: glutamate--tRNA ligase family protein [Chloroflexota bacterium]
MSRGATRFAPAPTGPLHLGHLANALYVWGLAGTTRRAVILRIEDHDRQRSRPEHETALLDDLDRLGLVPDRPSTAELRAGPSDYRQGDCGPRYAGALARLLDAGLAYACDCARSTFAAWRSTHGRSWSGAGCPGGCRGRALPLDSGLGIRVALGDGPEAWRDVLAGPQQGPVASDGDVLALDRLGNWTYAFCVVVDDLEQGIDLVVRGQDLLEATPVQIRLGRLLGRKEPPTFAHHALIRNRDGSKLSKATHATAVGSLLDSGRSAADLFGEAASLVGLIDRPRALRPEAFPGVVRERVGLPPSR